MSSILRFYDGSIFEISDHFIKVIFSFSSLSEKKNIASGDENLVLHLIKQYLDITAKKMSGQTGFSTRKISRIIKKLREAERIIRVGFDRKGYWEIRE